jgi:ribonucleotide reductase beta subunit family protein with ferritin-like domain
MHGVLASYLYNTYLDEYKKHTGIDLRTDSKYLLKLSTIVDEIISHEDAIINYVFRNSSTINDISAPDLKTFIRDRVNFVCEELQYAIIFKDVADNPIASWFYQGTKSIKLHDFFVAGTSQYRRNWSFDKLSVLPYIGANDED